MSAVPTGEVSANATARLSARATLGANWQSREMHGTTVGRDLRRATVSSTISVTRRLSFFVSASRGRIDGLWANGGFASLSLGLGARTTTSASVEGRDGRALTGVDLQRSAPVGPGIGYRVQATGLSEGSQIVEGDLRAQTRWAQLDVHQFVADGTRQRWAQVNGSLVAIGGRVLASRPVQDGYALVRVPQVKGVRAYVSQQEMGRTDRRGDLLVPNLLAYYGNQISIADADVPIDRTLTTRQLLLATPYRGGAIAEFPATRDWRVAGALVVPGDARALRGQHALDATVTVATPNGSIESWLGAEGELYLEGVGPGRFVVTVVSGDFRCEAALVVRASTAPVIRVGTLDCVPTEAAPQP
jgi:outer membrane usher protein